MPTLKKTGAPVASSLSASASAPGRPSAPRRFRENHSPFFTETDCCFPGGFLQLLPHREHLHQGPQLFLRADRMQLLQLVSCYSTFPFCSIESIPLNTDESHQSLQLRSAPPPPPSSMRPSAPRKLDFSSAFDFPLLFRKY